MAAECAPPPQKRCCTAGVVTDEKDGRQATLSRVFSGCAPSLLASPSSVVGFGGARPRGWGVAMGVGVGGGGGVRLWGRGR